MSDFGSQVLVNMVAQWASLFVVGLLSTVVIFCVTLSRRNRLFRFFGLEGGTGNVEIHIYMSDVKVPPGGAVYVDESIKNPAVLSTVVGAELLELPPIQELFGDGVLRFIPEGTRGNLARRHRAFSRIHVHAGACPRDASMLHGTTLVLVGGIEFNTATRHFQGLGGAYLGFERDEATSRSILRVLEGVEKWQSIPAHLDTMDLAIVQRQVLRDAGKTIFYVAGNGSNGTRAAVRYLVAYWEHLYRRFGTQNFAVCLQCERRSVNPLGYANPRRLSRMLKNSESVGHGAHS